MRGWGRGILADGESGDGDGENFVPVPTPSPRGDSQLVPIPVPVPNGGGEFSPKWGGPPADSGIPRPIAIPKWKRMVEDLQQQGKLRDCIAVCDVSGSMSGTPMEVCVALGLLISELSEEPWKGKVITFSANPQFHLIKGDDLKSKTEFIRTMEWGNNTDFQKVFDQILKVAIDGKIGQDQMVKRFSFSVIWSLIKHQGCIIIINFI